MGGSTLTPVTTLLLASASPARAALLRTAGVEPRIQPADVDEEAILAETTRTAGGTALPVGQSVQVLARAKAEMVAAANSGTDLVLGCDSLLELDGQGLGKPGNAQVARQRWAQMRGRAGVLHTGHWVISADGRAVGKTSATTVHFADISDAEIEAYIATGEPLNVAGAFTIDGRGGAFIHRIEGDHQTVVGLSLALLRDLVAELGIFWPQLWTSPA